MQNTWSNEAKERKDDFKDIIEKLNENKQYFSKKNLESTIMDFLRKERKEYMEEECEKIMKKAEEEITLLYAKFNEEPEKCPVCLDINVLKQKTLIECGHNVCYFCFIKLASKCNADKISVKCPQCRKYSHFNLGNSCGCCFISSNINISNSIGLMVDDHTQRAMAWAEDDEAYIE